MWPEIKNFNGSIFKRKLQSKYGTCVSLSWPTRHWTKSDFFPTFNDPSSIREWGWFQLLMIQHPKVRVEMVDFHDWKTTSDHYHDIELQYSCYWKSTITFEGIYFIFFFALGLLFPLIKQKQQVFLE